MARDKLTEYSATASENTVCGDVNIAENSALPSDMNNFAREVMSHLKAFSDGTDAITGLTVDGNIKLDGNYPTGTENVALGNQALDDSSLSGAYNTAIGHNSLSANSSGTRNTAVGRASMVSNTTGKYNVALGFSALESNTTADNNTAAGYNALAANTTGNSNAALGYSAMSANTTASDNTALGYLAMQDNTTGAANTAVGAAALGDNTTASNNTAIGRSALRVNTTGTENVAVGTFSLDANTTANNNVGVGRHALGGTTTGGGNTAVGDAAGITNSTGTFNTYIGGDAGSVATGGSNTFVGRYAGGTVTSGAKNTVLGRFNGNQDGVDIRTQNNHIVLSDGDGNAPVVIDTSRIRLGNAGSGVPNDSVWAGTATRSGSVFFSSGTNNDNHYLGIQSKSNSNMYLSKKSGYTDSTYISFFNNNTMNGSIRTTGSAVAYNTTSDYRVKENVADMTGAIARVKQLAPKRFNFIADDSVTVDGFLAHEAQAVVPEAVTGTHNQVDDDGNAVLQGIDQSKLVPLLTGALKEAIIKIETLETEMNALKARVTALETQ